MSDVEPDIVVVAKGLSNGFPLSAVVAKESLFDHGTKQIIFFHKWC
jgi:acetylornithine/succinyldiaminopimelate/putrescine aminotransferase